jgi:hypothetical protein
MALLPPRQLFQKTAACVNTLELLRFVQLASHAATKTEGEFRIRMDKSMDKSSR